MLFYPNKVARLGRVMETRAVGAQGPAASYLLDGHGP